MDYSNMGLSQKMIKAMKYAEDYAKKSGGTIGTEHIIAGILSIDSDTTRAMNEFGITRDIIPEIIRFTNGESPMLMISQKSNILLRNARMIANGGEVTPTMVVLALLNSRELESSVAMRAMKAFHVNIGGLAVTLKKLMSIEASTNLFGNIINMMTGGDDGDEDMEEMASNFNSSNKANESYDEDLPKELQGICQNMTARAKAGKYDPVIGRGKEIDRIIQILSRRTKNNPVLIGEPGVGKSAIVEGLAQAIVDGNVPDLLLNKKVVSLNMASTVAGTKYRGEFEERLENAIKTIQKSGDIILFIDEIHTVVNAGSSSDGSLDAANILKPMLARGELQTIGATTIDEYRKYIEKDAALERRFQPITVDPPSVEDTILILKGIRDKYEKHHGVIITDSAIDAAAEMSDRYINDRFLPDKAIDLIDEAASKKKITNFVTPDNIKAIEDSIQRCYADKESAVRNEDFDAAKKFKNKIEELTTKLEQEKKKWSESRKDVKLSIDDTDIANIISDWTRIPVTKLTEKEADRLLNLENILRKRVIGQEEAVASVSKAVRRARAGLKDPKKPIGTFIFLGPTGVGKTELSKALAEAMFGDEDLIIRIDMSEYMDKSDVSKLIGSAPGYVGYDEAGGQLTEKVRRKPYSVVLFDEIEKAHPDVFNILLQVLDDGRLTDSHGRTVSFKNTIIIMTSNIGAGEIKNTKLGFSNNNEEADYEAMKERQMDALKRAMKPEFINRIDDVIIFRSLNKKDIRSIADVQIAKLVKRLNEQNIKVEVTDAAKDFVAEKGFNSEYGARPLNRAIQKYIEDAMSEQILMNKIKIGQDIVVDVKDGELTFEPKKA